MFINQPPKRCRQHLNAPPSIHRSIHPPPRTPHACESKREPCASCDISRLSAQLLSLLSLPLCSPSMKKKTFAISIVRKTKTNKKQHTHTYARFNNYLHPGLIFSFGRQSETSRRSYTRTPQPSPFAPRRTQPFACIQFRINSAACSPT